MQIFTREKLCSVMQLISYTQRPIHTELSRQKQKILIYKQKVDAKAKLDIYPHCTQTYLIYIFLTFFFHATK